MQVVLSLRVGGLERVVVDLVNHASKDFEFVVCCLEEAGAWEKEVPRVVSLGKRPGIDWRMFGKIARLARDEKIDIIHTHNPTAHLYGAVAGRLTGRRVLHTEHGKNLGQEARSFRLNRFAARFTDFTVAVSEKVAGEARAFEGVRENKLQVVPNGIPVEYFVKPVDRVAVRQSLGLPAGAALVGTVGRLVIEKNYPLLLRAFAKLAGKREDVFLAFVGDGPLGKNLEELAGSLGLEKRVLFLGKRADVAALLASLDVFVLSSSTEGMSMALLEAMAAGCPTVVTAVGGNVELIQDGQTGLVVPPDDEPALAKALQVLLTDAAQAKRLAAAARDRVQTHYSVQQMTQRYETLYRRLVDGGVVR